MKLLDIDFKEKPEKKAIRFLTTTKYPKIMMLIITVILAYIIFSYPAVYEYIRNLRIGGYIGMFIAGILFAYGFTAPFATGYFITLNPENIYLAALIGGLGVLVGDQITFRVIRVNFADEFERLKYLKAIKKAQKLFENKFLNKIKVYLLYAIAGILLASPLPNEAGITMLASIKKIDARILAPISFTLGFLGILFLVWI